ncbi:MAG: hypothetical protein JWR80_4071 [Bradyrhizobium sp.]|nr:hypothetical protein [Bradyrhizobium sp.]
MNEDLFGAVLGTGYGIDVPATHVTGDVIPGLLDSAVRQRSTLNVHIASSNVPASFVTSLRD